MQTRKRNNDKKNRFNPRQGERSVWQLRGMVVLRTRPWEAGEVDRRKRRTRVDVALLDAFMLRRVCVCASILLSSSCAGIGSPRWRAMRRLRLRDGECVDSLTASGKNPIHILALICCAQTPFVPCLNPNKFYATRPCWRATDDARGRACVWPTQSCRPSSAWVRLRTNADLKFFGGTMSFTGLFCDDTEVLMEGKGRRGRDVGKLRL